MLSQNCSTVVAKALDVGLGWKQPLLLLSHPIGWKPLDVLNYGQRIKIAKEAPCYNLPLLIVFFCVFSGAIWGVQKDSLATFPTDMKQLPTEAECIANTKQTRELMTFMSTQESISSETLQKLDELLEKNLYFFKQSNNVENIIFNLFGTLVGINASKELFDESYQQHTEDYQ